MLNKKYRRRKQWRKVTNSMWSLIMSIVVIILLLVFGTMCGKYMKFMNEEGLPGSKTWH
ncbi:MAG: hypothetical protein O3C57_00305 [Verrucomicrobia bacterium]|nr:hypothetical protein [Verrucomicrobiota bacterium]